MDEAQAKVTDYVYLGGSLIAREESAAILPPTDVPVVTAPPNNTTGSYAISWTSSERATLYKLEEQKDGGAWAVVCEAPGLSCLLTLRSTGDYYYKARACNSAGCSDAGKPKLTQVSGVNGLPAPGGIVANPNPSHTGKFEVRWAPVNGATQYRLERKPLASGTWVQIYLGDNNAFAETGIEAGQYHYRVSACANACGDTTAPLMVTVTHVSGVLSAPAWTNPQGTSTTGTFTLQWSLVPGRTSYQLQELAPGNWAWANQTLTPLTSQSKSFTRPNGTYAYQIRTCNAAGCGDFGPIQTVTVAIPAAIATPENFNVNPARSLDGHAHLDWDNVDLPTAVSYELQRRAQSNGTWANLPAPTASEFDDSILTNGEYQYRVRACRSSNDCGNYAGPILLSVEIPIQPPGVVEWLTVSPTTSANGAFTLSWPPSTGATRYRITETINGGEATYYLPTATATNPETYAFSNRGNGVYVYKIAACKTGAAPPCSIDGTAQATVTVAIASGIAAPLWIQGPSSLPGVGCVEVGGGASYDFSIDWQSVAGATRYEVVEGDDQNGTYPNNPILVTPTSNPTFQRLHLTRSRAGNAEITYNYGVRACNATSCSEERRTAYMCLNSPGGPLRPLATTGVRYLHTDALGSPVAETDEFGTLVKRTRYEPYGAPTDGNYVNGPGFTGHVTDAATGLTYMQQRYYDPLAGQFLSLDPVVTNTTDGGNFSRYWYGNSNPYRFFDPDGRQAFPPQAMQQALEDILNKNVVVSAGVSTTLGAPIVGNSPASPGVGVTVGFSVSFTVPDGQVALNGSATPFAGVGGGAMVNGEVSVGISGSPLSTGISESTTTFVSASPTKGVDFGVAYNTSESGDSVSVAIRGGVGAYLGAGTGPTVTATVASPPLLVADEELEK